jgi:hypothetical protein
MASEFPRIPVPKLDKTTKKWVLTVERAPNDAITVEFDKRTPAREKRAMLLECATYIVPTGGFKRATIQGEQPLKTPQTIADYREVVNRALAAGANGELTPAEVDQTVRLVRLGMKLLQMKEPEDEELGQLSEMELLDRIFEQLTTEELLEMARERLEARAMEVAA